MPLAFLSVWQNSWHEQFQFHNLRVVSFSWQTGHDGAEKFTLWWSGSSVRQEWRGQNMSFKDTLLVTCFLQPGLTFQSSSPLKLSPWAGDNTSTMSLCWDDASSNPNSETHISRFSRGVGTPIYEVREISWCAFCKLKNQVVWPG